MEGASEVDVDSIRPNPSQPRQIFADEALHDLTESIRLHGVLQPVAVRRVQEGYELISGERRWRAAQAAGLRRIPVHVREGVSDEDMLALALVENLQRADLDPIERALGFRNLIDSLGLTQEEVARQVGLKRSTVANHLRLLELSEPTQQALRRGELSMGHARALLGVSDEVERARLTEAIGRDGLSVREVERRTRQTATLPLPDADLLERQIQPATADAARASRELAPWAAEMQARLRERLGTKVALRIGPDYRGQIVIECFERADLERVYRAIVPSETV